MKGLIFDIKRFAIHDGPGIRTTIFLKGCPLDCWWCHNPEGISQEIESITKEITLDDAVIKTTEDVGRWITLDEMMTEVEKERIFMEQSGGGVTFSGGEPMLQHKFLLAALHLCRSAGFHTCIDTSGHASPKIVKEAGVMADLILFDLKLMDEREHKKYTGISNEVILKNLEMFHKMPVELIIRIPLIPGVNTDSNRLDQILKHLKGLKDIEKVDLLPYHYFAGNKYRQLNKPDRMNGTAKLNDNQLEEIRQLFAGAGYRVSVGG
jgi:pyruvate formate lyase activating enzyme